MFQTLESDFMRCLMLISVIFIPGQETIQQLSGCKQLFISCKMFEHSPSGSAGVVVRPSGPPSLGKRVSQRVRPVLGRASGAGFPSFTGIAGWLWGYGMHMRKEAWDTNSSCQ